MNTMATIQKIFETRMGRAVHSIAEFGNVPNNRVFRIEAGPEAYIFKLYAKRDWPEDGKLPFITQKLDEYGIPHARLFAFDRDDANFPNGYLIEECLPGVTADRLSLSADGTVGLFEKLAALMSRVHQIPVTNFGYTSGGTAGWSTFSRFIYDMFDDCTANLGVAYTIHSMPLHEIREMLYMKLKDCDGYPPVICHGDLSTKNMLVHAGELVLIDWDDAQSLCWMADIARLTFWMKLNYDEPTADTCRNTFLDCYETPYDKCAFDGLEDYLHVWYGLDYLNFAVAATNYQYQKEAVEVILTKTLARITPPQSCTQQEE